MNGQMDPRMAAVMLAKKRAMAGAPMGRGMKKGGDVSMDKSQDKAMIKKAFKQHDAQEHKGSKGTSLKLAGGGSFRKAADGVAQRGRTAGTQIKMKNGGMC